ncbi:hypothetical protein V490_03103 [Pseudogymnoascus sp. VKM F-3557]|nr:hypothetical protein V490_03103 [Pseudogymnoascus sp. VKM F-3557]
MELDGRCPTDEEAWSYLVKHGNHITHKEPSKVQEAIVEVLGRNWRPKAVAETKTEDFAVVWSDDRYKSLATNVQDMPLADYLPMETIINLKKHRLDGYWDVVLERIVDWVELVFKESPRISYGDSYRILICGDTKTTGDYEFNLGKLFWDGDEAHKASNRKEGFLSYLSFAEYSKLYNALMMHPPDLGWASLAIHKEIRAHASYAKMIMLHVAFWYNPNLKEPGPGQVKKDPIYYHLREPFLKILPRRDHADTDEDWKSKALSLQRLVIDFVKANIRDIQSERGVTKAPMATMMKFYKERPNIYHERFMKGKFWDRLALEIRRKMPEIPFQHLDLLPYNSAGDNIYHAKGRRGSLLTTLKADLGEEGWPIADVTPEEGGPVAPEIEALIGKEYGSHTPPIKPDIGRERQTSTSIGYEAADRDTECDDTASSTLPSTSKSLGKRKTPSTNDASQPLRSGRRPFDFFGGVQRQSLGPSRDLPEQSPSLSANDRIQRRPIGPMPLAPPSAINSTTRRRASARLTSQSPALTAPPARMLSAPAGTVGASRSGLPSSEVVEQPPSAVASAAKRGGSVHSTARTRASVASPLPVASEARETTTPGATDAPQAEKALSSESKQAVKMVIDGYVFGVSISEHITFVNAVRCHNAAWVFLKLPHYMRKPWLLKEVETEADVDEPSCLSSEIKQAVDIAIEEFADPRTTMEERIAVVNAVRRHNIAWIFMKLPSHLRCTWLSHEILKKEYRKEGALSPEVMRAMEIVAGEIVADVTYEGLGILQHVAIVNKVRDRETAWIFTELPAHVRKPWLFKEMGGSTDRLMRGLDRFLGGAGI